MKTFASFNRTLAKITATLWWLSTAALTAFNHYNGESIPVSDTLWALGCLIFPPLCLIFTFTVGTWALGIIALTLIAASFLSYYIHTTTEETREPTLKEYEQAYMLTVGDEIHNKGGIPYKATIFSNNWKTSPTLYDGEGTLLLYPDNTATYVSPTNDRYNFTNKDIKQSGYTNSVPFGTNTTPNQKPEDTHYHIFTNTFNHITIPIEDMPLDPLLEWLHSE